MIIQTLNNNKINYTDIINNYGTGDYLFVTNNIIQAKTKTIINQQIADTQLSANQSTVLIDKAITADYAIIILNLYCNSDLIDNPPQITITCASGNTITKQYNLLNQSNNNISDIIKINCTIPRLTISITSSVNCTISSGSVDQQIILY